MVIRTFFVVTRIMKLYGKQNVMRLILLLTTLMTVIPAQALFNAGVNRTIIADYETLELTLRSDTDTSEAPDLKPLEEDFDILGTRQSRQVRIINGKSESWRDWIVTLMPKRTGNLTIPSLGLGSERSQPVNISVRSDINNDGNSAGKPVLMQTDVDSEEVYVQQEILFTMQILYRVSLYEDSRLTPLTIDNALVKQLGETEKFDTVLNGTRYKVFQLRFSIHPQEEGILQIPSLTFSGVAASNNDPFGSIFSSGGKPIVVRSQPIEIEVKARPDNYPQQNWLPARDLRLQETWSQSLDNLKVGDAITRSITIEADGLSAAQLPPVFLAQPESVNSYPDKSGSEDFQSENGVMGQRTDAIAMIPTRAGAIKLTAVKYTWFNTETNQTEVAEIPERTINVAPSSESVQASAAPVAPVPTQVQESPECPVPDITEPALTEPENSIWKTISLILALLWMATGIFWWLTRNRHKDSEMVAEQKPEIIPASVKEKKAYQGLEKACKSNDLNKIRSALKEWCLTYLDDPQLSSMAVYLQQLNSPELSALCASIDNNLYSGNEDAIDLKYLMEVCGAIRKEKKEKGNDSEVMSDIYPQ